MCLILGSHKTALSDELKVRGIKESPGCKALDMNKAKQISPCRNISEGLE